MSSTPAPWQATDLSDRPARPVMARDDVTNLAPPRIIQRATRRNMAQAQPPAAPVPLAQSDQNRPETSGSDSRGAEAFEQFPDNVPPENADFNTYVKLLAPPDGADSKRYMVVNTLPAEELISLQKWWDFYQKKDKDEFRRFWTFAHFKERCCGCKVVTRQNASWTGNMKRRWACKTCTNAKSAKRSLEDLRRPCMRVIGPRAEGETRVVEVLPLCLAEGRIASDGFTGHFGYWASEPPELNEAPKKPNKRSKR
ncbi:hypothetical protein DOTSEDRAFT_38354 [Dothistroma septosporum NZE10]|uniref:Uncharacterized protein n=1 Tax=Dothistroma septosporum (strain NZE10 / CBS 128990) TaxID=675120 RepID=M2YJL5_DOTSN|nr:hypothetical protein DOTSEDRAFT_38354 [Dothistroma septosporum NZE10]